MYTCVTVDKLDRVQKLAWLHVDELANGHRNRLCVDRLDTTVTEADCVWIDWIQRSQKLIAC